MIFPLITIVLIVGTAFLLRNATTKKTALSYFLVFIAGIITFLFEPIGLLFFTDGSVDGGAIQIVSTILGIYSVGWSILQMLKKKQASPFSVIKNLFSREDLNLQNRWWHRLIKIVFFIVLFTVLYNEVSDGIKQFELKRRHTQTFEDLGFEPIQTNTDPFASFGFEEDPTSVPVASPPTGKLNIKDLSPGSYKIVTPIQEETGFSEIFSKISKIILFDLFWFLVAVVFYYKVFLYIIFGSKKKDR
jgi:hypothetical protein